MRLCIFKDTLDATLAPKTRSKLKPYVGCELSWMSPHQAPLFPQEMAKSRPLDVKGQRGFKILILNEVDRLSREAQHSLRRTMEKYSSACRLVLACSNISKVGLHTSIDPWISYKVIPSAKQIELPNVMPQISTLI